MSAELGGIEKSMIEFLKYLVNRKHDVDLMLWKRTGELLKAIPPAVNMIANPAPGSISQIVRKKKLGGISRYVKLKLYTKVGIPWKAFPRLRKTYDIAISYTQDGYSPYYVIDNVVASKKYLWYHHGAYLGNNIKRDSIYFNSFNRVITVSSANKEMLIRYFPILGDNISVIPNLIDENQIIKMSKEHCDELDSYSGVKITTVGRVCPEKGQIFALEVAKLLTQSVPNFRWCFVGDGPEYEECRRRAKELEIDNKCLFVGRKENPYPYIRACDVYIQPSVVESEGITIKEALILHKPIIASDLPAIQETLSGHGLCCEMDRESFYREIIRALNNKAESRLFDYSYIQKVSELDQFF